MKVKFTTRLHEDLSKLSRFELGTWQDFESLSEMFNLLAGHRVWIAKQPGAQDSFVVQFQNDYD